MSERAAEKRASIYTLGCRLNQAESSMLEERLAEAGYALVPFGEAADLGIIHTCTVTQEADAKSRKMIRQFIRKNPRAFTVVIGCYAQLSADAISGIKGVDLILGNHNKLDLLEYVGEKNTAPVVVRERLRREDFALPVVRGRAALTRRSNLKIQDGCNCMCSFCIIPFARGRVRSREIENLAEEARSLVSRGAREIVLTGINIGTYDYQGRDLTAVVDRLNEIRGLRRLRISSLEPGTIPEALFERMRDPGHALTPYLHVPMQSGSDQVLKAMRRPYTRREYLDIVQRAAEGVPDIGMGGDIMVGFPGETDADFEDTCALFLESPLFYAHVFKYSERPGTASARLSDKVDPKVMTRRSAHLRRLGAEKTRQFQERHLGHCVEVLFEGREDTSTGETPLWGGYAGNYLRVTARSSEDLENQLRVARIEEIRGDTVYGTIR